jgi:hypothetical protein
MEQISSAHEQTAQEGAAKLAIAQQKGVALIINRTPQAPSTYISW